MEQAALMYRTTQAEQASERLSTWAQQWRPLTSDAIATLECDFEQTLIDPLSSVALL
jgi:hypothetical protein